MPDTFLFATAGFVGVIALLVKAGLVGNVLLGILAACYVYLLLLRVLNGKWGPQSPSDPPLISGWIPYLGCAIQFGAKGDDFLLECTKSHGPVFTLVLAGRRLTYVTDPTMWPSIIKNQASFAFQPVGFDVGIGGADIDPRDSHALEEDAHRALSKYLLTDTPTLTKRFAARLDEFLETEFPKGQVTFEKDLYHLASRAVFHSGLSALFGKQMPLVRDPEAAEKNLELFNDYDVSFPLFAGGMPEAVIPAKAKAAKSALINVMNPPEMSKTWSSYVSAIPGISPKDTPNPDFEAITADMPSPFYVARHLAFLTHGLQDHDPQFMGKLDLLMLWAAQGNTAPASYWTLRSILLAKERGDKWVSDLLAEIDASFADGAYDPNVSTPVLDACITEALRMNTSIFVMRQAVDSSVPPGPDTQVTDGPPVPIPGTPYSLPMGARLIMPVRAGMHFDSNLYGEDSWPPGVFDPMRHVEAGPGMTGKRTMPFGAGYSMCPGRRFATNEIRCLVAVLLKRYGLVLTDTGSDDFVPGRAGFGVQWAKRTAQARISIKG